MEYIRSTPPLFNQHLDSNRLHNWALSRLQNRYDIHKDIQEHNVQILTQDNFTLEFESTVKLNNLVHRPLPLAQPNITAQSLPPPFITTESIYKYDRYTKKTLGYIPFYQPYSGLSYTCIFKLSLSFKPSTFFQNQQILKTLLFEQELTIFFPHTMIVKKMNKNTNTIKQVTQCESEPQETEKTNIIAKFFSKARATTLT